MKLNNLRKGIENKLGFLKGLTTGVLTTAAIFTAINYSQLLLPKELADVIRNKGVSYLMRYQPGLREIELIPYEVPYDTIIQYSNEKRIIK